MGLLGIIVEKEIRDHLLSFKFTIIFLLSTFLIILSLYTGAENYHIQRTDYDLAVLQSKEDFESQEESSVRSLMWRGYSVHRPPSSLSTIVSGLEGSIGQNATINAWREPELANARFDSNPIFAIFGVLDLLFIVKIVLSLAAILFSYDLISGENETGTLRLMSSNPVPRDVIIIGKCLGGYLSLIIPLLIPILIGLIMVVLLFEVNFSLTDWIRLISIFGIFLLYIFVFFMIGIFVSTLTHRSRVSFLYLLVIWVCFVMIIPKVAVMIAEQVTNVPAKHQVDTRKRNIDFNMRKVMHDAIEKEMQQGEITRQQRRQRWSQLRQEYQDKSGAEKAAVDEEYRKKQRQMVRVAMTLSRISPTSSMVYSTMALGRTGITEYDRFMESIRKYRVSFTRFFGDFQRHGRDQVRRGRSNAPQQAVEDFSAFPQFRFVETPLAVSFREVLIDTALLVIFGLVFFMGAYMSFLRYPLAG